MRPRLSVPLAVLPLVLVACQDPSGVGLGLVGEEGTNPNVVVVAADTVRVVEAESVTGGFASAALRTQVRVLVGHVEDDVLGDATAAATFDVIPPAAVPGGFRSRVIRSAQLRLARDYVYGDSTTTLTLELLSMDANWSPTGAPPDTTFDVGEVLGTFERSARDTLLTFDLPASWVSENDELLRSDSAASAFDGFHLRLAEGSMTGAVVGLRMDRSALRLMTSQDTVDYPVHDVFTTLSRGAPTAPPPENRLFLREGASEAVALAFPIDTLGQAALAGATLRLNVDSTALPMGSFVRPLIERLGLFGLTEDDERVLITSAVLDRETGTYSLTSRGLTALLQDELLGDPPFVRYEVGPVAGAPLSLNVAPLVLGPPPAPGGRDPRPRLALTLIPATN
ncbi:MAG TPA: hypothetical protein VD962_10320 [Rubricoccaceae bacterium]|nr:hypothetical protein [Rubricoccaceae bacterium]